MAEPGPGTYTDFVLAQARDLRSGDALPENLAAWQERKKALRETMFAAMGTFPEMPCALEPRVVGVLKRPGYRIEKLVFQSLPDVWVTASAYVPEPTTEKRPAVLAVHGHWPWARRDPVVQARCLGLVHLGFFVLAVDAFGAGERHPRPAPGAYHGALLGAALWPVGQSLLGLQVYENRRSVDYLCSRPEVDSGRLGITGASGGGNQTMYAGALDERLAAVVPVCSVGTYQAYLRAACCVCEVLPGALCFTEEGDVLGLVAPRALLVINATGDALQFSVDEAKKSLARARGVFKLHGVEAKMAHAVFESPHAYNQAMRETMYGWMSRWLKNEGSGKAIPEPAHTVESHEDLACFAPGSRAAAYLFAPTLARREARRLLEPFQSQPPDHKEAWEARAIVMRGRLRSEVLGGFPKPPQSPGRQVGTKRSQSCVSLSILIQPEPGLALPAVVRLSQATMSKAPACVLLDLAGKDAALGHPLAAALNKKGWAVVAVDLRATGGLRPPGDARAGALDHDSAEHGLWIGRPLLGQWVCDVRAVLEWLAVQPQVRTDRLALAGIGFAGIVALCAAGLLEDRVTTAALIEAPSTFVPDKGYPAGWPMGLLAPGILQVGNVSHLAALVAPRPLLIASPAGAEGGKLTSGQTDQTFAFPTAIYRLLGAAAKLRLDGGIDAARCADWLGG